MPDDISSQDLSEEDGETAKILIIDDEKANIKVLRNILRDTAEIFFALDPTNGLEMAKTIRPDLILLDVVMPEIDGYELCRRMKQDSSTVDIPVIFVTSHTSAEEEEKGLAAGCIDFISKPLRPAIIMTRVKNQLLLQKSQKKLMKMAATDSLTDCFNRRHFLSLAEREQKRSIRQGYPLCICLFDLDYFKQVNDTWGHAAGDAVLINAANIVRDICRTTDLFARWGGEEFMLLLPDTDSEGAQILMERVRVKLAQSHIDFEGVQISISASFGLTEFDLEDDTINEAIKRADAAAYQAKGLGRNRVEIISKKEMA